MGSLLFSPSGRIDSSAFMKGAVILIVLTVILGLPAVLGLPDAVTMIASVISFATIWCWIVLWVKRYHDGGKSGWMCLLPIITYLIIFIIAFSVIAGGSFMEMMNATLDGATPEEIEAMEAQMTASTAIPLTVAGAVISFAIAFLFNSMIKHEDHDNRFGPETTTADTFS